MLLPMPLCLTQLPTLELISAKNVMQINTKHLFKQEWGCHLVLQQGVNLQPNLLPIRSYATLKKIYRITLFGRTIV